MCGIVGFVDQRKKSSEATLTKMTDVLISRGPDDRGITFIASEDNIVGLGHRRLSILDLSLHGHQPMEFEGYHLVYNGEVYNFKDIRDTLELEGYTFSSNSDTEVVLKGFHRWGISVVEKFRGMFAFCIVDTKKQKAYLLRDRTGIKPLYYYSDDNGLFMFSSELKSFHQHPDFKKELNKNSLAFYLQFGYIAAPLTIFDNTYKLHPGHYIEFDLKTHCFKEKKYWDVSEYYESDKIDLDETEVLDKLESILTESFLLRMVSDVPVGTFLSGGVDSTLVTAILQKNSTKPMQTFTIGFDEDVYDEAQNAREIASYLGTEHSEYYCTIDDMMDIIYEIPNIYDEPFADDSAIPMILLSRFAKEKVSVVLSGDGGDETFCGYSKYFALDRVANFVEPGMKKSALKMLISMIDEKYIVSLNKMLPGTIQQRNMKEKYQKFKRALFSENDFDMFVNASSPVDPKRIGKILKEGEVEYDEISFSGFNRMDDIALLEKMMLVDYKTYLPDEVLTKVDRATMSCSLEGREPLLDHTIIEFMANVPVDLKYKNGIGKYLAKELLYRYIPKELVDRPKAGFQLPLAEWLSGDLKKLVYRYLSKGKLDESGLYHTDAVLENVQNFYEGKTAHVNEIWHILNFEMWRERWL